MTHTICGVAATVVMVPHPPCVVRAGEVHVLEAATANVLRLQAERATRTLAAFVCVLC